MKTKAMMIIILFFILSCVTAKAETRDAYSVSGADRLGGTDELTAEEKSGKSQIDITQKILNIISGGLSSNGANAVKAAGIILGLMIISSVLKHTSYISQSAHLGAACDYISAAVISAAVFSFVSGLFRYVSACLSSLNVYTKALLPVMASLYSLGGCVNSAVTSTAVSYLFLSLSEIITSDAILPLLQTGFAFALVSSLPGPADLSSVCSLIKKTVNTALAFIFTIFGFIITIKSMISDSADRLAYRSIKLASSTFIPVIGSVIGDSAKTVFASVGVVKTTVGAAGMISILALTVPPLISVFLHKTAFGVCSAAAKAIGLERAAKLLDGVNELLGILTAIITGVSVIFIIICAVFMKAGGDL